MPDIYINTDRPVDRSIVAGINQPQREAPIGAFVAGSSYDVNLYFVKNDGSYNALSGVGGTDIHVAISTISRPESGTFTLTDGTDTTTALTYGASAQVVEDALNALNSDTGLNLGTVSLVDVVKVNDTQYTITFRTFGAMTALSGSTVSLFPESTPTGSIAVTGSSTVYAQQTIELTRQPAIFQETWSTITNGFSGTVALNTTRLLQSLALEPGQPFYLEVKLDAETVAREIVGVEHSTMPASAFSGAAIALKSTEGVDILSTGETGGTKYLREDGDGTSSWQTVAVAAEGTAILSTGETGAVKYLREDGDGTSSWQTVAGAAGDMEASTYDPTTVAGDAFAMDNMAEGATTKILTAAERTTIGAVAPHIADTANPHAVTKSQVGLGNVDNTADAAKPKPSSDQPTAYPLTIPTAAAEDNVTHPSVIDFMTHGLTSWNGYRYWMAHTPYPRLTGGNPADYENPTIVASHDGITWVEPVGISNPIATLAEAQAINAESWSDANIVYNPVNATLYCYYRNNGGTATESIRLRKSTDGITWGAEITTIDESVVGGADMLSPAVVIDNAGATSWLMWCVDVSTNFIRKFTSPDGETFTFDSNCIMPPDMLWWHLDVQKYHDKYYTLITDARSWSLFMFESSDGSTWQGDKFPFVARTGTDLDTGGNYKSCFTPVSHDRMKVWAVGMSGDLDDNNNTKAHKVYYTERDYKYLDANQYRPPRYKEELVETFTGGVANSSSTDDLVGDKNWSLWLNGSGGNAKTGAFINDSNAPYLGGLRLQTAAQNTTVCGIHMKGGVSTFPYRTAHILALNKFEISIGFQILVGTAVDVWVGLGGLVAASHTPTRFAGLRALDADTNWQYVCIGSGGTTVVDSGIAKHTSYVDFTLQHDGTDWQMFVSQEPPLTVTNNLGLSEGIAPSARIETKEAVAKYLLLGHFELSGIKG